MLVSGRNGGKWKVQKSSFILQHIMENGPLTFFTVKICGRCVLKSIKMTRRWSYFPF